MVGIRTRDSDVTEQNTNHLKSVNCNYLSLVRIYYKTMVYCISTISVFV